MNNDKITQLEEEQDKLFEKFQVSQAKEENKLEEFKDFVNSHIINYIKQESPNKIRYKDDFYLDIKTNSFFDYECQFIIRDNTNKGLFNSMGRIEYKYKQYDFEKSEYVIPPIDEKFNIEHQGIKYNPLEKNKYTPKEILEIQQYINYSAAVDKNIDELKKINKEKNKISQHFLNIKKQIEDEKENLKLSPIHEYVQANLANDNYINSIIDDLTQKIDEPNDGLFIGDAKSDEYLYFINPFDPKKENEKITLVKSFLQVEKTLKDRNSFSIQEAKLHDNNLQRYKRDIHKIGKKKITSFLKEKQCMKPNQFLDNYYEKNKELTLDEFIHQCKNLMLHKNLSDELGTKKRKKRQGNVL